MSDNEVELLDVISCDFCDKVARYDARMNMGSWAYMCEKHFDEHGIGLGLGKGQKITYKKGVML